MAENMNLILAVPPEHFKNIPKSGFNVAHMAYKINNSPYLFRADTAQDISGGIMAIDARDFLPSSHEAQLINEIISECRARNFRGILLDVNEEKASNASSLCSKLNIAANNTGLTFYTSSRIAQYTKNASLLVETAISGGTLISHLNRAVSKYGAGRIALDIERVRMDFTLPAYSGNGKSLTPKELSLLYNQRKAPAFFSKELCANYFTYRQGGHTHFVLYDNVMTIKRKLMLGERLGIKTAFLFYPEISDIINEIRGKRS